MGQGGESVELILRNFGVAAPFSLLPPPPRPGFALSVHVGSSLRINLLCVYPHARENAPSPDKTPLTSLWVCAIHTFTHPGPDKTPNDHKYRSAERRIAGHEHKGNGSLAISI